jgi:hypothetical protein
VVSVSVRRCDHKTAGQVEPDGDVDTHSSYVPPAP